MLLKLLKVLTFPIWFPLKVLWTLSKLIAFVFVLILLSLVIACAVHFSWF